MATQTIQLSLKTDTMHKAVSMEFAVPMQAEMLPILEHMFLNAARTLHQAYIESLKDSE